MLTHNVHKLRKRLRSRFVPDLSPTLLRAAFQAALRRENLVSAWASKIFGQASFPIKRIFSILLLFSAVTLLAQEPGSDGKITLTVILRHDQSMTVDEINDHLEKTGFRKTFPPEGVEIISYNIVMGIGHIITLRFPPYKLREVNLAFEHGVWGAFRTEFYPTYDYLKVFYELKQKDAGSGNTNPAGKEPESEKKPDEPAKPSPSKRPHRKTSE